MLLVTIDTLRADHVSAYGYRRATTPNLDRWMARGARLEWAFSTTSFTLPSHVSILTGLDPSFTSVGLENGQQYGLEPQAVTLAELCRDAGMYTAAVVSSETLAGLTGIGQGFEAFDDDVVPQHPRRPPPKQPADVTCRKALDLLAKRGGRPFFLWVHLIDPHGPYLPPESARRAWPADEVSSRSAGVLLPFGRDHSGYNAIPKYQAVEGSREYVDYVDRYDAEIAFADAQVGRLLDRIEADGLLADTWIVLTSDHGEALGEDNFYFAHSHSVALDQVRVPLTFIGPGVAAGSVLRRAASNADIFATVCDALELTVPAADGRIGRSLAAALRDGSEPPSRAAFFAAQSQRGAALDDLYYRHDRRPADDASFWRINVNSGGPHRPCRGEWIRLSDGMRPAAPGGASPQPELAAFERAAEAALATRTRVIVPRSPEHRRRLGALGYLADESMDTGSGGRTGPASSPAGSRPTSTPEADP